MLQDSERLVLLKPQENFQHIIITRAFMEFNIVLQNYAQSEKKRQIWNQETDFQTLYITSQICSLLKDN